MLSAPGLDDKRRAAAAGNLGWWWCVCVCVCVCVCLCLVWVSAGDIIALKPFRKPFRTRSCAPCGGSACVCVCVYACMRVCVCVCVCMWIEHHLAFFDKNKTNLSRLVSCTDAHAWLSSSRSLSCINCSSALKMWLSTQIAVYFLSKTKTETKTKTKNIKFKRTADQGDREDRSILQS